MSEQSLGRVYTHRDQDITAQIRSTAIWRLLSESEWDAGLFSQEQRGSIPTSLVMKKFFSSFLLLPVFVFVMLPSQAQAFSRSCSRFSQMAREYHWVVALVLILFVLFYFWLARSIRKEKGLVALFTLLLALMISLPLVVFDDLYGCSGVFYYNADKVVLVSNLAIIIGAFSVFVLTWWSVFFLAGVRFFRFYARRNALRKRAAVGFVVLLLGCVGAFYSFFVFLYLNSLYSGPADWSM